MFAHIYHTSNGMTELKDPDCAYSTNVADCGCKGNTIVSPESSYFYARGPMGLYGDTEYANFSKAFYEGFDRSDELLNAPDLVSDDGYFGFSSALWKWMVPKAGEPSAHSVMTGFYMPNSSDLQAGHTAGFGTTINIFDQPLCGTGSNTQGANER